MSVDWKALANKPSGLTRVHNIDLYLSSDSSQHSPIDRYYEQRRNAITIATPDLATAAPWLTAYILVSVVSATELYFREVFSKTISICPYSQKISAEQSIHIGSILWHGSDAYSKAAFEHLSFAGSEKIKKCSKDFLGHEIKKTSQTFKALDEFDTICELRHGIVHAGLSLPGKNATKLGANKVANKTFILPDIARLHEATAACTALVESYNSELYCTLVERWATTWRNPNWSKPIENDMLKKILHIFFSNSNAPTTRPSFVKIRNQIKKQYNIQ